MGNRKVKYYSGITIQRCSLASAEDRVIVRIGEMGRIYGEYQVEIPVFILMIVSLDREYYFDRNGGLIYSSMWTFQEGWLIIYVYSGPLV